MSEQRPSSAKTPWYDRNLAAAVVGGLMVALVVWGVPQLIGIVSKARISGWVYVVVAAVVLLIVTISIPALRRGIWGNVGRFFRWVRGLRVSTSDGRQRASESAKKAIVDQLNKELGETLESSLLPVVRKLTDKTAELELRRTQAAEAAKQKAAVDAAYQRGMKDGEVWRQAPAPTIPLPRPRWRVSRSAVQPNGSYTTLILENSVDRSIAKEVRIDPVDANTDRIDIIGGHWDDISGVTQRTFDGVFTSTGDYWGVRFDVSWYDENNTQQFDTVTLPGLPEPPSVWDESSPF